MSHPPAPILDCHDEPARLQAVRQAVQVLQDGGLVGFPTETVYGVAAALNSLAGLQRLQQYKQRSPDKPFAVHLPHPQAAALYVDLQAQPTLQRLIARTWPGPVTYVVQVKSAVRQACLERLGLTARQESLLYHRGAVGLRCPDDPTASTFLAAADGPVLASSANRTGRPEPHDARQAASELAGTAELVLDGGPCRYQRPSTVVRVDGQQIQVLRPGVYDQDYLEKMLRRTLLFVCSGNTCRSPMAEALARMQLARRLKVPADRLEQRGWQVLSAGLWACGGMPASEPAVQIIAQMGGDLSGHRSRSLTTRMVLQAERIYGMTEDHVQTLRTLWPQQADKVQRLDEQADLPDPVGGSLAVYRRTAERIAAAVRRRLDELL